MLGWLDEQAQSLDVHREDGRAALVQLRSPVPFAATPRKRMQGCVHEDGSAALRVHEDDSATLCVHEDDRAASLCHKAPARLLWSSIDWWGLGVGLGFRVFNKGSLEGGPPMPWELRRMLELRRQCSSWCCMYMRTCVCVSE